MGLAGEGNFENMFEHNKWLIWDTNSLDRAATISKSFASFLNEKLSKYPHALQETLRLMGAEHMMHHVNYQLKQAQTFTSASQSPGVQGMEEDLRTVVPNLKTSSTYLLTLLEGLQYSESADSYVRLRDLLVMQTTQTLTLLDQLLEAEKPYEVSGETFNWWDGKEESAYQAFAVKDDQELKEYLDTQRDRLTGLAKTFAQPLLNILRNPILKGADHNLILISKWGRILDQLASYTKKKPDNTLIALENFVSKDVNSITFGNCFEKIDSQELAKHTGDYFVEKRLELMKLMQNKCKKITFQSVVKSYKKLSDFFNDRLAGKFPFVSFETAKRMRDGINEATPEDVRQFYKMLSRLPDGALSIIQNDKRLINSRDKIEPFLKKAKETQKIFQAFMDSDEGQVAPAFNIIPEFRINHEHEIGGNQIIDYTAEFSEGQSLTLADSGQLTSWQYGDPITLTLTWPEGGKYLPAADHKQSALSTHGYSAHFYFKNKWALFAMLASHAARPGDLTGNEDHTPHILRFEVPVEHTSDDAASFSNSSATKESCVFIRLTVSAPSEGDDTPLKITSFPVSAPPMDYDPGDDEEDSDNDNDDQQNADSDNDNDDESQDDDEDADRGDSDNDGDDDGEDKDEEASDDDGKDKNEDTPDDEDAGTEDDDV